jgi:DNA relaxase NicK
MNQNLAPESSPYSNTGGKSSEISGEVLIDGLSLTMQLSALMSDGSTLSRWTHSDELIVNRFRLFLNRLFGSVFDIDPVICRGRNGFDNRIHLEGADNCFLAFGGNNIVNTPNGMEKRPERFQLYLSGEGCSLVQDWQKVYDALCAANLAGFDVRITRIDIACDFHEGQITYKDAQAAYHRGEFTTKGRPPKAEFIDDCGSGTGCTFYVGNRKSGKLFRAYEKGKQLGDKFSDWNRWECEWHGDNKRVIPFDVLINPKHYIAGAYRATSFISTITEVIKTSAKKTALVYKTARYWCRLQYGKLLNFANRGLGLDQQQIFHEFFDPSGFPGRLKHAASAA